MMELGLTPGEGARLCATWAEGKLLLLITVIFFSEEKT